MNSLMMVRSADDDDSGAGSDDENNLNFDSKPAMTLDEWEDLVGPDFVAVRESRWPESGRWRDVIEIVEES
eukprot:595051-Prymnesium_polylepis.1